ncbi:FMN-binding protein [Microbacterium gorillae]|uniref:FMN-binding protein n=1 Tax=Microbacterium gorillae TaxID=1231063 RepID=UPI00058F4954|nr:FMN-binding protein [Microbacterium gorillae]
MKRIVYVALSTLSALVLLFSYRTSLEAVAPTAAADTSPTPSASADSGGSSSTGPSDSGSSSTGSSDSGSSSTGSSDSGSSSGGSSDTGSSGSGSSGNGSTSDGGTSTSSGTAAYRDGTFTGDAADTRYGPVQVAVTVSGGRITGVQVPQYPTTERRDQEINSQALPMLISETTQAQSAQIQMISGATFTSEGYLQSLQSALDQAGAK